MWKVWWRSEPRPPELDNIEEQEVLGDTAEAPHSAKSQHARWTGQTIQRQPLRLRLKHVRWTRQTIQPDCTALNVEVIMGTRQKQRINHWRQPLRTLWTAKDTCDANWYFAKTLSLMVTSRHRQVDYHHVNLTVLPPGTGIIWTVRNWVEQEGCKYVISIYFSRSKSPDI